MTEAELATVRQLYYLWNEGGPAAMAPVCSPQLVWVDPPEVPGADTYAGFDAAVAHLQQLISDVGHFQNVIEDVIDAGRAAIVVARMLSQAPLSGIPIDLAYTHVVEMRDGLVAHVRGFLDHEQALAAVRSD
jgi:ketosteroid isomerase-like protein